MKVPTPITDLKTIEMRDINATINGIIKDIERGTVNAQDHIFRLHAIAAHLPPIDDKLMERYNANK